MRPAVLAGGSEVERLREVYQVEDGARCLLLLIAPQGANFVFAVVII